MKIDSKSHKITIDGDVYTLVSDENEAHIQSVGSLIDAMIKELRLKNRSMASNKLAILATIQCASRMLHAQEFAQEHSSMVANLIKYIDEELVRIG